MPMKPCDDSIALLGKGAANNREMFGKRNGGMKDAIKLGWSFSHDIWLFPRRLYHKEPYYRGMKDIPYFAGWEPTVGIIREEAKQLTQEGRDSRWIKNVLAHADLERADDPALADVWNRLQEAPPQSGYVFVEPNDLGEIRARRSTGKRRFPIAYSEEEFDRRMLGAWLGRCCGCALGKPVEPFMDSYRGLSSRERIKIYLKAVAPDEYPLKNYFPGSSPAEGRTGSLGSPLSQREKIGFMETDDDIRYTVLGQKVLLEKGGSFGTGEVMKSWIEQLPYASVCTAETQAYRNYILRYRTHLGAQVEADWDWVATHQNPYREWIGAQIRADSWGYAVPGNPELAAEFAYRDARMSHVKNGIYGEMFVAAMIAAGFALEDPLEVVEAGLAEIPCDSRLNLEMRQVIALCRKHSFKAEAFEKVFDGIYARLGHYHPVHTINNAGLVVAALLLGQADFENVITIAVMGGWDTDCNGATAGSIFGAMHGAGSIPSKWKDPLHDTLYSQVFDYHPIAISECARRSAAIARKIVISKYAA